jgi:nitrogenase molybdenum-iron protein alpha/beta subunit
VEKNSVGLMGRAGQDADSLGVLTSFLKEAGITTYAFPVGHIDEMSKIVKSEYLLPIQLVPFHTCKTLSQKFGAKTEYLEIPVGIEGTSRFFNGVADLLGNQKLREIVKRERERVLPRLEKIKARFKEERVRALLVTGPSNEVSIGKILAEFGALVTIVPSMRNAFARKEKALLEARYGDRIHFHEQDYNLVADLVDLYKPDVVFADFHARVEITRKLIPALITENYLNEYGYDYALDLGEYFFDNLKRPVFAEWKNLMNRYAGGTHA